MPNFDYLRDRVAHAVRRLEQKGLWNTGVRVWQTWCEWRDRMEAEAEREADYYYARMSR